MNFSIEKCPGYSDDRGDLIQFVTQQLLESYNLSFGQIYLLTFNKKSTVRGNHYHKYSSEMFCLIAGGVEMIFEDIETKERITKIIYAENNNFFRIYVGNMIAHSIISLTDFAVMVSFSSKEYDSEKLDKIIYQLC